LKVILKKKQGRKRKRRRLHEAKISPLKEKPRNKAESLKVFE
jgi:hypothetical protein